MFHLLSKPAVRRAAILAAAMLPVVSSAAFADPTRGGTLRYEIQQEGEALVAINNTSGLATDIGPKIFDGLFSYDNDLKPIPQLALSWSATPDGLAYTFKLRPGVKWHDGKDFSAEDVAFSILRLKVAQPRGRATFANVKEVQTPDPLTAIVVLSKPAPYLVTALASRESPIVAKHVLEGTEPNATPTTAQLIGTGPFVFKEWVRGDHIILERNPNYWDQGKPYLDRIVIRVISDAGAIAAAFEAGEIDIGGDVALPDVERLKADPKLGVEARAVPYSADNRNLTFNLDRPNVKDVRVRQAIAHAVDPEVILKTVYYGFGQVSNTPISPVLVKFHNSAIKPHVIDVALANKLLDDAGYAKKADGTRFSLKLLYNTYLDPREAEYVKQALAKLGIAATIENLEFGAYVKRAYTDRDWDITLEGLNNIFDPVIGVQRIYWSKNFKIGLPFSNGSHYVNAEVDKLLESAASEPEEAKRKALYDRFQEIIDRDLPVINLVAIDDVIAHGANVKDYAPGAEGISNNFANLSLDK